MGAVCMLSPENDDIGTGDLAGKIVAQSAITHDVMPIIVADTERFHDILEALSEAEILHKIILVLDEQSGRRPMKELVEQIDMDFQELIINDLHRDLDALYEEILADESTPEHKRYNCSYDPKKPVNILLTNRMGRYCSGTPP